MRLHECMDEKTVKMMQDWCQEMRKFANEQLADEDCRKEFFMCMATQFFLYSLTNKNNRFVALADDDFEKAKKDFLEMLDIATIGYIEDKE